eukprot:scaffold223969_cov30-Tisochrysis_lutea.AAC.4
MEPSARSLDLPRTTPISTGATCESWLRLNLSTAWVGVAPVTSRDQDSNGAKCERTRFSTTTGGRMRIRVIRAGGEGKAGSASRRRAAREIAAVGGGSSEGARALRLCESR